MYDPKADQVMTIAFSSDKKMLKFRETAE